MKKTLAILLALAMVFSTLTVAFAEGTIGADAQACATLGMLKGDTSAGVTADYVAQAPTRLTAAILFLRLKGLENEALAYTGTDNFADVNQVNWAGGKAILGYLKAHPELGWVGDQGKFAPNDKITAQQYYKVMLETLGYKQSTTSVVGDFAFDKTVEFAATKGLTKVATVTSFTVNDVAVATIEALKANLKEGGKTLAQSLVDAKVITADAAKSAGVVAEAAALAVSSVTANTAKSFEVKFNKAVEDTSKIAFEVTRGTVKATVTTTWNSDKTVATLAAAAKLPEAVYTIVVKNDNVELAKQNAEIGKEVVKTIEYVANKVVRMNNNEGMVNFKVLNQYGEDVTNLALGRNISFISSTSVSVPTVDYKAGTIKITHGTTTDVFQLKDMKTVTLTARDTSTGFVQTNVLEVSDTVGVIADIKLLGIVDENGNKVDFKWDKSKTYYLDYEATDVLGNKVYNYTALTSTLYGQNVLAVNSSNTSLVTVTPEKHPKDNTKLAYRLNLIGTSAPSYDTPVTFLAIAPYAGKNSNLTVTLLRKAAVDKFNMQNPAETASMNKAIEIPFEAFDQAGNPVTKYDDLAGKIQFSTAQVGFVRQADGTAKLFGTFPAKQTYYITSTVNGSLTGSFSQIAIDVKDTAVPTTIEALRHDKAYITGSEYGDDEFLRISSITIRDQFDRKMNLRTNVQGQNYAVRISTSNASILDVAIVGSTATVTAPTGYTKAIQISGDQRFTFVGGATAGTASILYELIDTAHGNAVIDSASTIAYNLEKSDIKSIAYTTGEDAIYMASNDAVAYELALNGELYNDAEIVGKTDSGMDVILPIDSNLWFTTTNNHLTVDSYGDIVADQPFTSDVKTSSGIVTANFKGSNGVLTASATVNVNSAAPVVDSISASYNSAAQRLGNMSVNNNVVEFVSAAWFNANVIGKDLLFYAQDGTYNTPAQVSFYANTSYGTWVVNRIDITRTAGTGSLTISNANQGTLAGTVVSGDNYTITALTNNGKSLVLTFVIK